MKVTATEEESKAQKRKWKKSKMKRGHGQWRTASTQTVGQHDTIVRLSVAVAVRLGWPGSKG